MSRDGFHVKVEGFAEANKYLEALKKISPQAAREEVEKTGLLVETEAKQNCPVGADGKLRASIHAELDKKEIVSTVEANAGHAVYVEHGSRAHFPPVEALERWVRLVLGVSAKSARSVAFLVARKINKKGTPAQPFLFPAADGQAQPFVKRLKDRLKKETERLSK